MQITTFENYTSLINKKFDRLQSLLKNSNQFWAGELTHQIINELDKNIDSSSEKINFLNRLIDLWSNYLTSLNENFLENWPFIYNAYNLLFQILLLSKDFPRIFDYGIQLIKWLSKIKFASNDQIAGLLEALEAVSFEAKDLRMTIQILYLILYFREKNISTQVFEKALAISNNILKKLNPNQRPFMVYAIIEYTYYNFFHDSNKDEMDEDKFSSFLDAVHRNVTTSGEILHDSINSVKRNLNQYMNSPPNAEEIQSIIQNLQMIHEYDWTLIFVIFLTKRMWSHGQQQESIQYITDFIEICIKSGSYVTAFNGYQYLADLRISNLDHFKAETAQAWTYAAKLFRSLNDKTFFVRSLQKLEETFIVPIEENTFNDFSYAKNEYYRLKRGYISPTNEDFWWAIFHRSVFEEGFDDIAVMSAKKLKIFDQSIVGQLIINKVPETAKNIQEDAQIAPDVEIGGMVPKQINIRWRIQHQGIMKLHTTIIYNNEFTDEKILQIDEAWQDPNLLNLYQQLITPFEQNPDPDTEINAIRYGKIMYLLLPKELRKLNFQLKLRNQIPMLQVISEDPCIPIELIYGHKSPFGVKYGIGYRFKEPPLTQIAKVKPECLDKENKVDHKINILVIGNLNEEIPRAWNEDEQHNVPLLEFKTADEILGISSDKITTLNYAIGESNIFKSDNCTRENIEKAISSGQNQIIQLISNLFYLEESPIDSYFITPDYKILSIRDIDEMLSFARDHNKIQKIPFYRPLLIITGRVLKPDYEEIARPFDIFVNISKTIELKNILGLFTHITNNWNQIIRDMLGVFLERLLLGESIGSALVTANRNQFLAIRNLRSDSENDDFIREVNETQFVFFGEPWNALETS